MSKRTNQVNVGGTVTTSGGAMPVGNYTNEHKVLSRAAANKVASITVVGSGNAVEIGGDGGLYDTVANKAVLRENTNIDTIGI